MDELLENLDGAPSDGSLGPGPSGNLGSSTTKPKRRRKQKKTVQQLSGEVSIADGQNNLEDEIDDASELPRHEGSQESSHKLSKRNRKAKKPASIRGRPKTLKQNQRETVDKESGAMYNFAYQRLTKRKNIKFDYGKSFAWLSFFKEEEKGALIKALQELGLDASPQAIYENYLPSRSVQDISEFLRLLRQNSRKIALSSEFDLGFGVSAMDAVNCREAVIRACSKKESAESEKIFPDIKQAILEISETPDVSGEPVDDHTIDFERIYRVMACAFDPSSTVDSLRTLCNGYDLGFLMHFVRNCDQVAAQIVKDNTDLVKVLQAHVQHVYKPSRKASDDVAPFAPAVPPQSCGNLAHKIACTEELNPLRLPPEVLIGHGRNSNGDHDIGYGENPERNDDLSDC
ncbi:uncharacterized protein LOC129580642 [Paramacrobiotus metropolitanus]|uniref:uncharacterized protein LOC129580642 n=1 Tax=Paramacrobiotus metropolitanus TaxID=2943436 RepID=UPI002445B778|nr:uncharacterized protein LOC129580642 [Paramacrobiotus metropolitanus]